MRNHFCINRLVLERGVILSKTIKHKGEQRSGKPRRYILAIPLAIYDTQNRNARADDRAETVRVRIVMSRFRPTKFYI